MAETTKQIIEMTNVDVEGNVIGTVYPQTVPAAIIGIEKVISTKFKEYIKVYKLSVSGNSSDKISLPEISGYMPFELISMSGLDYKSTGIAKDADSNTYTAEVANVIEVGVNVSYKCIYIAIL